MKSTERNLEARDTPRGPSHDPCGRLRVSRDYRVGRQVPRASEILEQRASYGRFIEHRMKRFKVGLRICRQATPLLPAFLPTASIRSTARRALPATSGSTSTP